MDGVVTSQLAEDGWGKMRLQIAVESLDQLRGSHFELGLVGERCLLDHPTVAKVACEIRERLRDAGLLPSAAVAIQAIAFDKTSAANWKVSWHQDVMFPFAAAVKTPGYSLPTRKENVDYARPPRGVLEQLLAVRLHLDDCDRSNGPLRVVPRSHRLGVLKSSEIPALVASMTEVVCTAEVNEVILMRPLLLHASSQALSPRHRRVLHFVFHSGAHVPEAWHRSI